MDVDNPWWRLLAGLLDECNDGTFWGERRAVDIYIRIHARLTKGMNP